jgi:hypothetical protein
MPAIKKPSDHFNAVLYSGANPSSQTVGVGFQPDFVWIKSRTQTYGNYLFDVVRTPTFGLITNSTDGDSTGDALTFTANGFTTTASAGATNDTTGAPNNFISWNWKAGSSNVTNNDGTKTSTVRANRTAGFSVVSYTGDGATAGTVGHGLGTKPAFIIVKNRSAAGGWVCWHRGLTGGSEEDRYIYLNSTDASGTTTDYWGTGGITSSVFGTWTTGGDNNNSGSNFIAYCWSEIEGFSKFGSYTGNGSTNGPFIYTGFKPKFVLVKRIDESGYGWHLLDSVRNTSNVVGRVLIPNSTAAESDDAGNYGTDFLSNGFKSRTTGAGMNASGGTYIYMAFAEAPFKYSSAR